jgi:hypothetical protein
MTKIVSMLNILFLPALLMQDPGQGLLSRSPSREEIRKTSLEMVAPRSEILVGEPLLVVLRVTNRTGDPIRRLPVNLRSWTQFQITLGVGGAPLQLHTPGVRWRDEDDRVLTLMPGESYRFSSFLIDTKRKDDDGLPRTALLLTSAGEYRIRVRWRTGDDGEAPTFTDPVTVRLREPKGEDAEAFRILQTLEHSERLYYSRLQASRVAFAHLVDEWYKRPYEADAAKLERVLERFPRSRYARYAKFYLGSFLLETSLAKGGDKPFVVLDRERLDRGLRMLRELAEGEPDDEVITPQALGRIATVIEKEPADGPELGEMVEAKKRELTELGRRFARTDYVQSDLGSFVDLPSLIERK